LDEGAKDKIINFLAARKSQRNSNIKMRSVGSFFGEKSWGCWAVLCHCKKECCATLRILNLLNLK